MRTKFGGCAGSFARFVATLFLCVLLVPCVPENGRADAAVTLAVTPFLAQGTSIQLGSAVSEAITSELVGHRDLVIVERSQFAALAKEHRLALSGLVDEKTAVRTGKLVGANYFLVGAVTRFGSIVVATARLVDVRTAVVLASFERISRDGEDDIALASKNLAADILATVTGKTPAKGKATEDYRYYLYEALGRYNLGNLSASIPFWEKMTRMSPEHALLRFILGGILFENGRYQDALLAARQAAMFDPTLAEASLLAGKCYFMMGDYYKATPELEKAMKLAPNLPEPYFLMGQSYKNRKRTEEAADFFARAVAADDRYVPAYLALGQLFFEVGALDEAAEVLEDALEIDGKNAEAQMLLGMIHSLRGEDAKARRMLSALEKNDPNKAKQLRKWMENK